MSRILNFNYSLFIISISFINNENFINIMNVSVKLYKYFLLFSVCRQ